MECLLSNVIIRIYYGLLMREEKELKNGQYFKNNILKPNLDWLVLEHMQW